MGEEKVNNKWSKCKTKRRMQDGRGLPVVIRTAMIAEIVAVEITTTATDNAPM